MRLNLRFLALSDVDRVEAFYTSLTSIGYSRAAFEALANPRYLSIILEDCETDSIIGISCSYRSWTSAFSTAREGCLAAFGIAKAYQRQGLGSFLLNLTYTILSSFYSCEYVVAHIPKSSEVAFRFFENRGLFAQRVIPCFYQMQGQEERVDSVLLFRRFGRAVDQLVVPEGIEIQEGIRGMIRNKQSLGWFARWREDA
jgi:ribosomal protein S18 acetylase RimI-like enzyme